MLRVARIEDSFAIAAIYRHYVNTTAITLENVAPKVPFIRYKIAKLGAVLPFLVAEEDEEVLGYAYATRYGSKPAFRWSLQDSIYLREDARGRGLGSRLLAALLKLLWELGYVKVYAVVTPPNRAGMALHEKLGFTPLCRFSNTAFKLGAWHDTDWMELTLRAPSNFPRSRLSSPWPSPISSTPTPDCSHPSSKPEKEHGHHRRPLRHPYPRSICALPREKGRGEP